MSAKTKKELINEYKQQKQPMGVFRIRNTVTGKIFVGSTMNLAAMWNRLRLQLDTGSHPIADLQNDWKQLGEQAFKYETVSELEHKETEATADYQAELKLLEKMCIEELQPFGEKGYNKPQIGA